MGKAWRQGCRELQRVEVGGPAVKDSLRELKDMTEEYLTTRSGQAY